MGFVTCLGRSEAAVVERLRNGKHGFSKVVLRPGLQLPITVTGTVPDYKFDTSNCSEWVLPPDCALGPEDDLSSLPPHGVYAIDALEQALAQAGLSYDEIRDPTTGLYAASGGSPFLLRHHLGRYEERQWRRGHPMGIVRSIAGTLNFNLAARYGIRGATGGFVSACTSSSHALGHAHDEIVLGRQTRMLVIGAEECLLENVMPFDAMRALTTNPNPDQASRPFDRARDGFVVTGGAVALVLERADLAKRPPLAIFSGWGQASDGHHVASPHPEGAGIQLAMKRALHAGQVRPEEVDHINAHATSTQAGDRAEALALKNLFPPNLVQPAITSTKGLTGHGLSLSGIMEAAFAILTLKNQFVPANQNLEQPDDTTEGLLLPIETRSLNPTTVLNNSSGFGGSNVCQVFRHPEAA